MKLKNLFLFVLALAILVSALPMHIIAKAAEDSTPTTHSLENILKVPYGTGVGNLAAGSYEPGDAVFVSPDVYTISENGYVYIVDKFNKNQTSPIMQFDENGKFIKSISGELFTNNKLIIDIICNDDVLYAYTGENLVIYNPDTESIDTISVPDVQNAQFFRLIKLEQYIALIYDKSISLNNESCRMPCFQTFDTQTKTFVDNILSETYTFNENNIHIFTLTYKDFSLSKQSISAIPLGFDKDGNFVTLTVWALSDTYEVFDMNGKRLAWGNVENGAMTEPTLNKAVVARFINGTLFRYSCDPINTSKGYDIYTYSLENAHGELKGVLYKSFDVGVLNAVNEQIQEEQEAVPENCITILFNMTLPEPNAGPMHYTVMENGNIYVVDSMRDYNAYGSCLIGYSPTGEYIETIYDRDLGDEFRLGIGNVFYCNNILYVLPCFEYGAQSFLCAFDPQTRNVEKFAMPDLVEEVGDFLINTTINIITAGNRYIIGIKYGYDTASFIFDTVKKEFVFELTCGYKNIYNKVYDKQNHAAVITFLGEKYYIPAGNEKQYEIDVIGLDKDKNIIVQWVHDGMITYRAYSTDSKLVGVMRADFPDIYVGDYPAVVWNGELYIANSSRTDYYIDKVIFNPDYCKDEYDINFDGLENTGDAVLVLKYCAKLAQFDWEKVAKADVDKNGDVNTGDAVMLLKLAAGMHL